MHSSVWLIWMLGPTERVRLSLTSYLVLGTTEMSSSFERTWQVGNLPNDALGSIMSYDNRT